MKLHPRVTRAAVELVKGFETFRPRATRLRRGGWTIGYGHTRTARQGAEVSAADAEALLAYDLTRTAEAIDSLVLAPLNRNQFDALLSFVFNIGVENFRRSNLLKRLNEGQYLGAAMEIERWRKAEVGGDSVIVDALVRRRAAEKARFLTPPEGFPKTSTPMLRPAYDPPRARAAEEGGEGTREEQPVPSAALEAAHLVSERLQELVPEPEPELELQPAGEAPAALELEPEPAPPADEAVEPEPAAVEAAIPEPPAPAAAEPVVGPEPRAEVEPEPPPLELELEAPPFPEELPPVETEDEPVLSADAERLVQTEGMIEAEAPPAPPSASVGEPTAEPAPVLRDRPPFSRAAHTATPPLEAAGPAGWMADGARLAALSGLVGLVLFGGAVLSILDNQPSPVNLALGLVGVVCMVPALYRFMGGRRSAREEA